MNSGVVHIKRQRGVILLAFFAVLFLAGVGVLISVLDGNAIAQRRSSNTSMAMREAKEALIAYAALYAEYYSTILPAPGPGYLPCPDSNNDGNEGPACPALGRLPQSIVLPNGNIFSLSDYNADIDEQFWYSVSATFNRSALGELNSSTISATTLDGQTRIAAVIIAPGAANAGQSRPSNNSNRYLEDSNTAAPDFVSSTAVNPDLFNDRVLAITIDEIMGPVTRHVANLIKAELDAYHLVNAAYPAGITQAIPADITEAIIAPVETWFDDNRWFENTNYVRVTNNEATLTFTGCPNISYTVLYDPPNTPDDLRRTGLRC